MTSPPAGWYPDPALADAVRWWDGSRWTEHVTSTYPGRRLEDGARLAGWWQRVGQYTLDSLILQAISLPFAIPIQVMLQEEVQHAFDQLRIDTGGADPEPGVVWDTLMDAAGPYFAALLLIGFVLFSLYWVICLRRHGQTIGMRALGIRVRTVQPGEGPLPWGVIARRVVAQQGGVLLLLVPGVPLLLAVALFYLWQLLDQLWPLWDRRSQTLHDKIAGTVVVRLP